MPLEPDDAQRHDHDLGLRHDLPRLVSRRSALAVLAGGFGSVLVGCGADARGPAAGAPPAGAGVVAEETAGPFPANGSNGPDVLTASGVVRRDITRSFADASGTADGLPTRLEMTLLDVAGGGGPMAGAAVYVWHCTRDGAYSLYEEPVLGENFLRGVQAAGADGKVVFDTIFPGAYRGRYPHVHFEVYASLDLATASQPKLRTSQVALPKDACDLAYASAGYEGSRANFAQVSLESDGVFADGYASQLAKSSGSAGDGLALTLNVGV